MRNIYTGLCVGKFKGHSKKVDKDFSISYFTYDLDGKTSEGQGVFSVFEDCVVGEQYRFIFENGKAILLPDELF